MAEESGGTEKSRMVTGTLEWAKLIWLREGMEEGRKEGKELKVVGKGRT